MAGFDSLKHILITNFNNVYCFFLSKRNLKNKDQLLPTDTLRGVIFWVSWYTMGVNFTACFNSDFELKNSIKAWYII